MILFSIKTTSPDTGHFFIDGGDVEADWRGASFSLLATSKIRKRSQIRTEALEAGLIGTVKCSMGGDLQVNIRPAKHLVFKVNLKCVSILLRPIESEPLWPQCLHPNISSPISYSASPTARCRLYSLQWTHFSCQVLFFFVPALKSTSLFYCGKRL